LIFVTVGNAVQGFNRLMEAVEKANREGAFGEDVLVQYGHSTVVPTGCRSRQFLAREEFRMLVWDASLIITHAGAGTIGQCIKAGKRPLVVPRLKAYGELVNDHQIELVRQLESLGRIYAVHNLQSLPDVVRLARSLGARQAVSGTDSPVLCIVREYLEIICKEHSRAGEVKPG
jgi:UDP-N-acetylglucosamine transferase subunit ALG13